MTPSTTSAAARRNRFATAFLSAVVGSAAIAGSATALPFINDAPTARFTVAVNPVAVGDLETFDARTSSDPDGYVNKYEWDMNGDGVYEFRAHGRTLTTATHRYSGVGTVNVRLRVTDNNGATATRTIPVRVHAKPVALLSADRAVPNVGDVVGYRATGSYDPDPDGGISAYAWDLDGDGLFERSTGASPYITTSFPTAGQHKLAVRVFDRHYAYTDQAVIVRVNKRPTAVVSATPNPAIVSEPVALSGSASTDDRQIVKYEWDLNGDGTYETNTAATPTTTTMFTALGQAKVGLQVTDSDGATDQSVATITVNAAPVRDTTAPRVTITPNSVRMSFGYATFRVACPVDELSCDTTLTLRGTRGALRGKVLGRTSEMIPGGEIIEMSVPLSAKAKAAIRRNRSIPAIASARATDAAGNTAAASKQVRIRR